MIKKIISLAVMFLAIFFLVLYSINLNVNRDVETAKKVEDAQIGEYLRAINSSIDYIVRDIYADIKVLESSDDFESFLILGDDTHLSNEFLHLAEQNSEFVQIRYINQSGDEVLRVDNYDSPILVEDALLQSKANRSYFQLASSLNEESLFISNLDFNIENDELVTPLEPVIRFALPIVYEGDKRGILVINYDGIEFLKIIQSNVDHFSFPLTIGIVDDQSFWAANNEEEGHNFIYISENVQPDASVFQFKNDEGNTIIDDETIHVKKLILDSEIPVYTQASGESIHLIAIYDEDSLALFIDNYFYNNPANKYLTAVFIAIGISFLVVLTFTRLKAYNNSKVYSFISEFSDDGILITNSKIKVTYTNETFNKMFGTNDTDLIGQKAGDKISASHRLITKTSKTRRTGNVWNLNANGDYVMLRINIEKISGFFNTVNNHVALYKKSDEFRYSIEDLNSTKKTDFSQIIVDFFLKIYDKQVEKENLFLVLLELKKPEKFSYESRVVYDHYEDLVNIISYRFDVKVKFYVSNRVIAFYIDGGDTIQATSILNRLNEVFVNDSVVNKEYYTAISKISEKSPENDIKVAFLMLELSKIFNTQIDETTPKIIDTFLRHTQIIKLLESDFENINFYIDYQAKRDVNSSEIHGLEALIRIKDPELGRIAPNEFMPLIERMNRTRELSTILIKTILCDLSKIEIPEDDNFNISINLGAEDLDVNHLIANIIDPIMKSDLRVSLFGFEIVETTLVSDIAKGEKALKLLRSYGFKLLLDDFGVGYSSLSYVSQLNFDIIKIDRQFIANDSKKVRIVLETMVLLCTLLGVKSVVEGVETKEQLEVIRKLGVSYYQGFYDSIPMSLKEAVKPLLLKQRQVK